MNFANKRKQAQKIIDALIKTFPDAQIELVYKKDDAWQLLVVVALSAQTTDKKVNEISGALFERFKNVHEFADADPKDIEPYLKTIGLYRNKAKNLVLAAKKLVSDFNGEVPRDRASLETLAGVGKKTSAVIVSNAFAEPAIAVDTHVSRVSRRLGLTGCTDPDRIEEELTVLFKKDLLLKAHHALIFHGRRICFARKPHCTACPLESLCAKVGVTSYQ